MFLLVTGSVIAVAVALAVLYDYRAIRRGSQVSTWDENALHGGIGARAQTIDLVHRKRS